MCGWYTFLQIQKTRRYEREIVSAIDTSYPGNQMKTGEFFSTNTAPILHYFFVKSLKRAESLETATFLSPGNKI